MFWSLIKQNSRDYILTILFFLEIKTYKIYEPKATTNRDSVEEKVPVFGFSEVWLPPLQFDELAPPTIKLF